MVPVVSLPITDYVSCGIVIYGLYYVKVYSIYIQFVKSFYHERMLYLSNAFYASIETIVWCLYFILSVWCIAFIDFHKLRYLHSRDKPCLIMIYDPFNVLLNSVCQYFIEKFYTYTYTFYTPCWAEAQTAIKTAGRNINNPRYVDDTTLMAQSEEELKSLLMKVEEKSGKIGLKLNIQKTKIMASGPITS